MNATSIVPLRRNPAGSSESRAGTLPAEVLVWGSPAWCRWLAKVLSSVWPDLRIVTGADVLQTAAAVSERMVVLLVEEPERAVLGKLAAGAAGFAAGLRSAVADAAAAVDLAAQSPHRAWAVDDHADGTAIAESVLEFIAGGPMPWPSRAMIDRSGPAPSPSGAAPAKTPESGEVFSPELRRRVIEAALKPLHDTLTTGVRQAIRWPRELFMAGDRTNTRVAPTVEVAGRPRILIYGPYLDVPSGHWTVRATVGFSRDIYQLPFIFDIYTDDTIFRGWLMPKQGGIYVTSFPFTFDQRAVRAQIRISSQETALEGRMSLIDVEFVPRDGAA